MDGRKKAMENPLLFGEQQFSNLYPWPAHCQLRDQRKLKQIERVHL